MSTVYAKPGESFESLYRRFKRAVERSGILSELKKYEYYEKPSVKRKRKQAAARKRELKRQLKAEKTPSNRNLNFKFNKDHTQKIPLNKPKAKFKGVATTNNSERKPFNKDKRPYNKYQNKPQSKDRK